MWKKWTALGLLAALLLVGCGGINANLNPIQQMPQAEDELKAAALSLSDEAEGLFADVLPTTLHGLAPQGGDTRTLTFVQDGDGITILAALKGVGFPSQPSNLPGNPLGLTIRCTSTQPRRCAAYVGNISSNGETQGYRVVWYGEKGGGGVRQSEPVPLTFATAETPGEPAAKPRWSYNKIGLGGFWADAWVRWPDIEAHLQFPLPSIPGQALTRSLDPSPFEESLRRACCGLPKPFEVEWPPAILLREDITLAILPYQNPRLREAQSVEELLEQPLGIAYWRTVLDAPRIMQLKLVREEPDYLLLATDLRDPTRAVRFRVNQVGWCDGCFGQDPRPGETIPRYLGIEDRLGNPPVFHLQVGKLYLRGIEKKDIR
jgi:hypothetical protein